MSLSNGFVDQMSIRLGVDFSCFLQIGLSLVSDRRREELMFAEASGCHFLFMQRDEGQLLEMKLTNVQVDSQLVSVDFWLHIWVDGLGL